MTTIEQAHKHPVIASTEWMVDAACRDMGPDLFYPEVGGKAAQAKAVCRRCKVRLECLEFALQWGSSPYDQGVWGGSTPDERHKIRVSRRRRQQSA